MYFKKVPKSEKCVIVVAIENAKLKLVKVLSSYNNALCDSSKLFFFFFFFFFLQKLTPETEDLWIFSAK